MTSEERHNLGRQPGVTLDTGYILDDETSQFANSVPATLQQLFGKCQRYEPSTFFY